MLIWGELTIYACDLEIKTILMHLGRDAFNMQSVFQAILRST